MNEFKLKLDDDQIKIINNSLGGMRFLYNKVIRDLDFNYKKNKKIIIKDLDLYIKENDFLCELDYLSLQISKLEAEYKFYNLIDKNKNYKLTNILKRKDNKVQSYFISNKFKDINVEDCFISIPMLPTRLHMIISEDKKNNTKDDAIYCIEIKKVEEEYIIVIYYSFDEIFFSKNIFKIKNRIINKQKNNFDFEITFDQLFPNKINDRNTGTVFSTSSIIGVSRNLDSFAVISTGIKISLDDSLSDRRKKYFRESIKIRNRIRGSLGSKKNIEENLHFQGRVKNLKKITKSLDEKYRLFVDKTSQQLVEIFDEIYIEDINCNQSCFRVEGDKFITNIDVNVDVSYYKKKKEIKDKKLNEVIEVKGIDELENTVDDVYWCMFLHLLEKYASEKGKKIIKVKMNPIEGIEFNEFERYSIGKSKGGKRGQKFNKEQKILKKKKSMSKYKYFSNPSRAREILFKGLNS